MSFFVFPAEWHSLQVSMIWFAIIPRQREDMVKYRFAHCHLVAKQHSGTAPFLTRQLCSHSLGRYGLWLQKSLLHTTFDKLPALKTHGQNGQIPGFCSQNPCCTTSRAINASNSRLTASKARLRLFGGKDLKTITYGIFRTLQNRSSPPSWLEHFAIENIHSLQTIPAHLKALLNQKHP